MGMLLLVSIILAGTIAGQRYVAARRLAGAHVPDPRDAPVAALGLAHPAGIVAEVTALDSGRRLVMLAGPPPPTCAPDVSCDQPPTYDRLLELRTTTGATLWQAPLGGQLQHATALAVDESRGLVDVVSQSGVAVFDAATGAARATFALPHGATTSLLTVAAATGDGAVALTAEEQSAPVLLAFDALSGAPRFDRPLPPQSMSQGPVVAGGSGVALVLTAIPGQTLLTAYALADGAPRASVAVPAGARLGPFDAAHGRLYLFLPAGTTAMLTLSELLAVGPASVAAPPAAAPTALPWLQGAFALGWNGALGHLYAVETARVRVIDAATGATLAALPLGVSAPAAATPLAVDEVDGVLALPAGKGTIVSLGDGRALPARVSDATTAAILARAAYTRLVAPGPQRPAFLTTATFLPGPGTVDVPFWTHSSSAGWQSASPGSAAIVVAAAHSGGFDVTFTVRWTQHSFLHVHTTLVHVAPAGGVQLVRDGGDPLP
jgi:hypothetical protein